ncbi:MAG: ASKHA domain-containing protein [Defluviitaleaceae bacterium]|nr:ASKHA domain-containing protein [Defluviitaleaceae bacterium]
MQKTAEHDTFLMDRLSCAVDIGTTNIELALVDLASGEIVARHGFVNPQRAFGADVISRIHAANNGHLEEMQDLIQNALADGIKSLCENKISEIVVAGNTAMIHFFLGLSCEGLGKFPFETADTKLPQNIIPWLTPFVGGDITAGLLHVLPLAAAAGKKRFILIDLGTNGEMVFYDNGKLTVAAAAAGPAFERTRGGASAAISGLARLIRSGAVDETGFLAPRACVAGDTCSRSRMQLKIDDVSDTEKYDIINFSQKKIRDLQLAKSAVRSGLEILLEAAEGEPDALYLAGGMGANIDADDAAAIGLIPPYFCDKTIAVGNSALGGAVRLLLSPESARNDLQEILKKPTEIILAEHPNFEKLFIQHISW